MSLVRNYSKPVETAIWSTKRVVATAGGGGGVAVSMIVTGVEVVNPCHVVVDAVDTVVVVSVVDTVDVAVVVVVVVAFVVDQQIDLRHSNASPPTHRNRWIGTNKLKQ